MSRVEQFEEASVVEDEKDNDPAVEQWLMFGYYAKFAFIWMMMAVPIILIVDARFF